MNNQNINNHFVIYSAIVGNYDDVRQPKIVDERFDYVLFTNEIKEKKIGVWQIRPIEYQNADSTLICRYIKTHPHTLLPEYEVSIWMDSNIQICSEYLYRRVIELEREGVVISSMWHPTGCAYQEAFDVMALKLEHEKVVTHWCHKLRQEGYPRENGLCETNVLYRKNCNDRVIDFDNLWWNCVENNSRRDQLSYNYALWKLGISCHYFMGKESNTRNTEHFHPNSHNHERHRYCNIDKNEAWLMRYYWKRKEKRDEIANVYYRLYALPFPQLAVAIVGQVYRIKFLLESNH